MAFKVPLEKLLIKLDRFSPYPLLYPFIMSDSEKSIFNEIIKGSHYYLEFGLGGSTLRALQKSQATIYTVESNPEWIKYMRKYIYFKYFENKRLHIFPVNIGPVHHWGYPESDNFKEHFEKYSSSIFQAIDSKLLDLALVDGRFRMACTLKIILECHKNNNIKILIHDFWNRPHYKVVLKYLDTVNKVDTLGLFSIKKDIDLKSVKIDYDIYKSNPE